MKRWGYGLAGVVAVIAITAAGTWFGLVDPRRPDGSLTCSVVLQAVADESALHRDVLGPTPVYSGPVDLGGHFQDAPSDPLHDIDVVPPDCIDRAHKAGYIVRDDYAVSIPMIHIEPDGQEVQIMFFQRCGGTCGVGGTMVYKRTGVGWRQTERHVSVVG